MATSTQQKAKDMSQFWQDGQAKLSQPKSSDFNQNFINNSVGNAYQQQKNDYNQQYNKQQNDMYLWAQNGQSIKTNQDNINRQTQQNQDAAAYQRQDNQYADRNSKRSMAGGGESFGIGAAPPSGNSTNIWGQRTDNTHNVIDWQDRQAQALGSLKIASQNQAAGDVMRIQAQTIANGYAYNPGNFQYWGGKV